MKAFLKYWQFLLNYSLEQMILLGIKHLMTTKRNLKIKYTGMEQYVKYY